MGIKDWENMVSKEFLKWIYSMAKKRYDLVQDYIFDRWGKTKDEMIEEHVIYHIKRELILLGYCIECNCGGCFVCDNDLSGKPNALKDRFFCDCGACFNCVGGPDYGIE